jgi:teichuronic acid biosynthesis glycosyltransferase TuaG
MTAESTISFSVIIPAYNSSGTIDRALKSVLEQSYPAHEIIVVDDASTDDTMGKLAVYGDRIKVLQKVSNCGSSIARNTAWDIATGNYIAFLDADDEWHRDKLILVSNILIARPGISLFYHPFTQDQIVGKKLPEDIMLYRLPFIKLLPANPIATSCAVVRNDPKYRFDEAMRYTEDYDLFLRIAYKYGAYCIRIPLTQIFRAFTSKGGISQNRWKMRKGEMRAYTKLIRLNPLFVLLVPFLITSSLGKQIFKSLFSRG